MECLHANGYGMYEYIRPRDDRGHMVASSLGGPAKAYNLIPQHPLVNRNFRMHQDGSWYEHERKVADFIEVRGRTCPVVKYKVAVNYHHKSISLRPRGFKIEADYYESKTKFGLGLKKDNDSKYYTNEFECNESDMRPI